MHSIETALGILNVDLSWAVGTVLLAHDAVQWKRAAAPSQACRDKGKQLTHWGLMLNALQHHHIFNL